MRLPRGWKFWGVEAPGGCRPGHAKETKPLTRGDRVPGLEKWSGEAPVGLAAICLDFLKDGLRLLHYNRWRSIRKP
ncbi:hypothetical protein WDL1P1_00235 (plasmid) [Variovorax sp. WDL1]|nr:hypothetical protein WDL1P1_00235 [Variovorax sp. WDL1]